MKDVRYYTLVGATGVIRSAKFEERDFIVVPVIALVEGVIQAMNAAAPEMVLAEEFAKVPSGWNGRPVMADHPVRNGIPVSANHPEILEAESVGLVFNSSIKGKKLTMEAWIDVAKAKKTTKGLSLLERAEKGLPIEVSVGVFVTSESAPGVFNGKQFFTVWRDIVPDHLALLSEGSTGACSMEMGCGVRAAAKNKLTEEGVDIVAEPVATTKSFRERVAEFFGFKVNEGVTANELHNQLWDALYASEPGFAGIDDILLDESAVVYSTSPEQNGYKTFRRGYSKNDEGSVNLADDRSEVKRKSSWVPVAAGSAPCGCGNKAEEVHINEEKKPMAVEKQTERIKALCDSKKNHFSEELHGSFLRALGENDLKALEDIDAKAPEPKTEEPKTPAVASAPKTEEPKAPVTVESYVASAPPEIQEVLNAGIRAAKAEKVSIIAQLKTSKSNPFTDAQLEAKPVEELRQLLQFAGIAAPATNYSVQGTPRTAQESKETVEHADPAPDMVAMLQAAKK